MSNYFVLALGLVAQGLFAGRFIIQMFESDRIKKVTAPTLFWQLSLLASFLLIVYGFVRNDIVIVGGQLIGYLIYIRNLVIQGKWDLLPKFVRFSAWVLPSVFLLFLVFGLDFNWENFLANPEIDSLLLTWGTFGQVIFTSRFVIQWIHSEQNRESAFPTSFWYISIVGALMISVYAVFRKDAVLFIGQAFGLLVYFRNLQIHYRSQGKPLISLAKWNANLPIFALLFFLSLVLFFNLGNWGVTESSEARYAQISKEMLVSGDYIHPTLMGIYHYHKPPVTYWITAVAYQLFGVSPWSARFFLQIAILIQVWIVFSISKILLEGSTVAWRAALLYSSFVLVIAAGRALTTDIYLVTFVLAALLFWFLYLKNYKNFHLLLFYLFLGLGFLTKGPVVLIAPVVVLAFQGFFLKISFGKTLIHLLGIALFLFVGLGWFVFLYVENRQFLDYFVLKHTVDRFSTNAFSRSQPFWFYLPMVLVTAFPWIIVAFLKFKEIEIKSPYWMLLAWIVFPLFFFSLSQSKLALYVLPIYPGIAMAAALVWEKMSPARQKSWGLIQSVFQLLIVLALVAMPWFDTRIVLNYKFFFILISMATVLVSLWIIRIPDSERALWSAVVFMGGITAASTYFLGANPSLVNDQRNLAMFLQNDLGSTENVLVYDSRLPSLSFATDKNIISLYDGSDDLNRETQFQKDDRWRENLINLREHPDWLEEHVPARSVLVVKKSKLGDTLEARVKRVFLNQKQIDGWVLYY
ncbi:Polymyxin resistance protein ArnT [Mariniradius saccharolyticus AK6]|uniref:Polymyxin resistance protein ArnT n=1 Tax=Mariniradius saccharolyticus AK6 TaxID=1239962 RepID=M7Y5W4_9BACT|nr:lipid-A-disaccharide synthase N-terminal domain-containing protein [Mariniradius saccharolyticus]EMS32646.1 Polymyxin resistance protein ArnT [Mariniradius saccharolyticus AK6]